MVLGLVFVGFTSIHGVFGQVDTTCPSCVKILPEEIEDYKRLFPLTIWTEYSVYDRDSIIHINGFLRPENAASPVTITVISPIGNIVAVDQLTPSQSGEFSFSLNPSGPTWKQDGDYVIKASSGASSRVFKTKITLVSDELGSRTSCNLNEIHIYGNNGGRYCISYSTSNEKFGGVTGTLDVNSKTLSINIRDETIESIEIDIPRYLLDAKSESGGDSSFIVMSSGNIIDFKEMDSNSEFRKIQINYPDTTKGSVQIMGTKVIPEFGTVAMIVLVAAFSSILILGRPFSHKFVKL